MKIVVGYPPTFSEKGTVLLSQNRQLQWFNNPTFLFPVVLGTGATWLNKNGHQVWWKDCIAEGIKTQEFLKFLEENKPELFIFETKSPVVKKHWKIIDELKTRFPEMKIVLCGDHVSYLPGESMEKSKVDFVINGGYYDFAMVELVEALEKGEKSIPGVWYREEGKIIDNGRYNFTRHLDEAPIVDREFTRNDLYQKEFNLKGRPLAYIMSGRDCYWGRCTFCFHPDTEIFTNRGIIPIKEMRNNTKVLSHNGKLQEKEDFFENYYSGDMVSFDVQNIPLPVKCTPNHKFFALKAGEEKPSFVKAEDLEEKDFLTYPIITEIVNQDKIDAYELINKTFTPIETKNKVLSKDKIEKIYELKQKGYSQNQILKELNIDRDALLNYLEFKDEVGKITLKLEDGKVRFKGGTKSIPREIPLNEGFMRLAGYYLAEGCVSPRKDRPNSLTLSFTFSKEETEYINDVKSLLIEIFDIEPILVNNEVNNTIQITIGSNVLGYFFKSLFGENAYNKHVPNEFIKLPQEKQKQLLCGIFRGDAHLRPLDKRAKEYIHSATSKNLAYQLWSILTRIGIIPSFYISRKENREKAKSDQYVLSICGAELQKLGFVGEEYVLEHPTKSIRNVYMKDNYVYLPIKSKSSEEYMGLVYNMQVAEDNSYAANLVSASNCVWDHTLYPKGTFRARTPENVMEEVKYLVDDQKVKEIFDDAGTITVGPWLRKFCHLMIESGYNKKVMYSCNMRFGAVTPEDYRLMKKAGFRLLKYGLESGTQKTLDKLDKGTKVEVIIPSAKAAKDAGLTVHLTMMVGYPWETKEDALQTLDLAKTLMHKGYADVLQSTIVMPYPGTPLYKEAAEKGWLLMDPYDYEKLDMTEPILDTPNVPREEIMKICDRIYTDIFFHPKYMIQHLKRIKSWDDVVYTLRGVKAVFGHIKDFSRPVSKMEKKESESIIVPETVKKVETTAPPAAPPIA